VYQRQAGSDSDKAMIARTPHAHRTAERHRLRRRSFFVLATIPCGSPASASGQRPVAEELTLYPDFGAWCFSQNALAFGCW
jgi:hypothetical protein